MYHTNKENNVNINEDLNDFNKLYLDQMLNDFSDLKFSISQNFESFHSYSMSIDNDKNNTTTSQLAMSDLSNNSLEIGRYCERNADLDLNSDEQQLNYFSNVDISSVRQQILKNSIYAGDFNLKEIWNSAEQHDNSTSMISLVSKMERKFMDSYWKNCTQRLELLSTVKECSRKAQVAISRNNSSNQLTNNKNRIPFAPISLSAVPRHCDDNTRIINNNSYNVAMNVAEEALRCNKLWSVLADVSIASSVCLIDNCSDIIFLKESIKLFDKEMLVFRNTFVALIKSLGTNAIDNSGEATIRIRGCRYTRHKAIQYHKRYLFEKLRALISKHYSGDIDNCAIHQHESNQNSKYLPMFVQLSIYCSLIQDRWLRNCCPENAIAYALESLNRAAESDTEDNWIEAYILLQSICQLLSTCNKESTRTDQENDAILTAKQDTEIYFQYTECKLESCYLKKLLVGAFHSQTSTNWKLFRTQFERAVHCWEHLQIRIDYFSEVTFSNSGGISFIKREIVSSKKMLLEYKTCILIRICNFDQFRVYSSVPSSACAQLETSSNYNHMLFDSALESSSELLSNINELVSQFQEDKRYDSLEYSSEISGVESLAVNNTFIFNLKSLRSLFCKHIVDLLKLCLLQSNIVIDNAEICSQACKNLVKSCNVVGSTTEDSMGSEHIDLQNAIASCICKWEHSSKKHKRLHDIIKELIVIVQQQLCGYERVDELRDLLALVSDRIRYSDVQLTSFTNLGPILLAEYLYQQHTLLSKTESNIYQNLSSSKSIEEWIAALSDVPKFQTAMSKLNKQLRKYSNFKISLVSCNCCPQEAIALHRNCKSNVFSFLISKILLIAKSKVIDVCSIESKIIIWQSIESLCCSSKQSKVITENDLRECSSLHEIVKKEILSCKEELLMLQQNQINISANLMFCVSMSCVVLFTAFLNYKR